MSSLGSPSILAAQEEEEGEEREESRGKTEGEESVWAMEME